MVTSGGAQKNKHSKEGSKRRNFSRTHRKSDSSCFLDVINGSGEDDAFDGGVLTSA